MHAVTDVPPITCAGCRETIGPDALYAYGQEYRWRLLCAACVAKAAPRWPWDRFRSCRHCGRRRYYWNGSPRSYCTEACETAARRARRRHPRWQKRLTCFGCERLFTTTRFDARYCSNACRQRAYRARVGAS
jgi:hypothetical protein